MSGLAGKTAAVLVPVAIAAAAGCGLAAAWSAAPPAPPASRHAAVRAVAGAEPVLGASVPSPLAPGLARFAKAAGRKPGIVAYYQRFGTPFSQGPAGLILGDGAVPLLQWDPRTTSLRAIAAGRDDAYLRSFAATVKAFPSPIVISFAHEMNGPWWPWGKAQGPAAYVAAWRRIHDVFADSGVTNVTWLWNPNVVSGPAVSDPAAWWPGSRYVDWTGLDGYWWRPGDTFASIFSAGIAEMRRLAPGKPVIIAEVGAYAGPGMAADVTGLFRGAEADGLKAVVYFDHDGHSDWRIEKNPAAAAAFRAAVREGWS